MNEFPMWRLHSILHLLNNGKFVQGNEIHLLYYQHYEEKHNYSYVQCGMLKEVKNTSKAVKND